MSNNLTFWEDKKNLDCVRNIFAKNLTQSEWSTFLEIGKATGLNPFLREIWAVKWGNKDAQIFIGRDGYRKRSVENKDYDGHIVGAVYSNDEFKEHLGTVTHDYKLNDRGFLIGAYCSVYRKSKRIPAYVFAPISEYNTSQSVWSGKPETMIKKVAEAQALKMAFPSQFNGTYSEYEAWDEKQKAPEIRVVKDEEPKEYASKADQLAASMNDDHVEDIIVDYDPAPKKVFNAYGYVDRLKELGADYDDIMNECGVDFIDDIDESHKDILISIGKRLNETQKAA